MNNLVDLVELSYEELIGKFIANYIEINVANLYCLLTIKYNNQPLATYITEFYSIRS